MSRKDTLFEIKEKAVLVKDQWEIDDFLVDDLDAAEERIRERIADGVADRRITKEEADEYDRQMKAALDS